MERPVATAEHHATFRPFVAHAGNGTTRPPLSPATSAPSAERPRSATSRTSSLSNRTAACRRSEESGSNRGGNNLISSRFANHRPGPAEERAPLTTDEGPARPLDQFCTVWTCRGRGESENLHPRYICRFQTRIRTPKFRTHPQPLRAAASDESAAVRPDVAAAPRPYQPSAPPETQHPRRTVEPRECLSGASAGQTEHGNRADALESLT